MRLRHCMLLAASLPLAACERQTGTTVDAPGQTGLAIEAAVDVGTDIDVNLVQVGIDRIPCFDGEAFEPLGRTLTAPLRDRLLPPGIAALASSPLDKSAAHPVVDRLEDVPPGCYDVRVTPMNAAGTAHAGCAPARAHAVTVNAGRTTDVVLINDCKAKGGVHAKVAFDQSPAITKLTYDPSKLIHRGESATICATAGDPDGDALELIWASADDGGAKQVAAPVVVSRDQKGGDAVECAKVTPDAVGEAWFVVSAYDLIQDEQGNLVRVEAWLREHGYPNDSHASVRFPIHVGVAVEP